MPRSDRQQPNYIPAFEERTAAAIAKLPRKCMAIKIPISVLADRNLTAAEKTLFGIVLATDLSDDGSHWSNDTIEALTGLCQNSITKAYAKLAACGLVEVEYKLENGRTRRTVKSLFDWALVKGGEGSKICYPSKKHYDSKNLLANISSKEDIKDIKTLIPGGAPSAPASGETIASKQSTANAARQRAAARSRKPDPAIQRIVDHFSASYAHQLQGRRYPVSRTRDYPAAKSAYASLGEADAKACADFFLTSPAMQWARTNRGITLSIAFEQRTITKFHAEKPARRQGGGFSGARVHTVNV